MQYVGRVGDYVYNQWNSLNPATLSGAIDILVIEQPDGSLQCSPWHVRFGKFQIIKPLDKKIDVYINDQKTDLPMKLGEGGEAFFVFETDSNDLSQSVVTSPVISAASSPPMSPSAESQDTKNEFEDLDLNLNVAPNSDEIESKIRLSSSPAPSTRAGTPSSPRSEALRITFEKVKNITKKLNIPSKIDINGDVILDMDGYKPSAEKNIALSDKLVHDIFLKEMYNSLEGAEGGNMDEGKPGFTEYDLLQSVIKKDKDGCIRIINKDPEMEFLDSAEDVEAATLQLAPEVVTTTAPEGSNIDPNEDKVYIKTLRLTSMQLAEMKLQYGRNRLKFRLSQGTSQIESDLYLWKSTTPIVISDIDGTITKSDALGHVLNMFGKDWTHPGVANLFQDINKNGYNILYLTARSAGQADTTRQYLDSINQDGMRLPKGPVILSPDRTMAALRREIILKKPEVFKMACLRDIKSLFFQKKESKDKNRDEEEDEEDDRTPFYAGFGNRITDAISYRSVKIPSHRIFTINPNGEVHMELLELAGYRSTYLRIGELVDQFFPPLRYIADFNGYWDQDQLDNYMSKRDGDLTDDDGNRSPVCPGSPRSINSAEHIFRADEKYTDLNYWRENLDYLSDLSDEEDDSTGEQKSSPSLPKFLALSPLSSPKFPATKPRDSSPSQFSLSSTKDRPLSSTFSSPLKSFMGRSLKTEPKPMKDIIGQDNDSANVTIDDDEYFTDDYDDDEEADQSGHDDGEDDEEDEDDHDDEEEDDEDDDDDEEEEDYDYTSDEDQELELADQSLIPSDDEEDEEEDDIDQELLDDGLDLDDDIDEDDIDAEGIEEDLTHKNDMAIQDSEKDEANGVPQAEITTAGEMLKKMKLKQEI